MLSAHTRKIYLSPVRDVDTKTLFLWRNSNTYRDLCSFRGGVVTYSEYLVELETDRCKDRHEQYIVRASSTGAAVGTVFSYGYSPTDDYVFITVFMDHSVRGLGYGVHATALFISYLFMEYDLYKIYSDVYSHNSTSIKPLVRFGFAEEGRFIGHRKKDGQRRDVIRFAAHKETMERAYALALRLGAVEL